MKFNEITESTTSGSVATVSAPIGGTQSRGQGVYPQKKVGNLLKGKKVKGKFVNSLSEAELAEHDLILVPGQGHRLKSGFVPHGKSRLDQEVEMAKSDLYQAAKNAKSVYELIKDRTEDEGLEGWVQEKIIKANDYLNSVREYLEGKQIHEMTGGVIAGGGVGESAQDSELFENGFVMFSEMLSNLVAEGKLTQLQATLIYVFTVTAPFLALFGVLNAGDIKREIKNMYRDFKDKRKINSAQIKAIADMAKDAVLSIEEPGKKRFLVSLIKKYQNADITDKSSVLSLQRQIQSYVDGQKKDVQEGADFGSYYYEKVAKQVFDQNPNLQSEEAVLVRAFDIVTKDLGMNPTRKLFYYDEDFPSDLVSAYSFLKKQTVAEGAKVDRMVKHIAKSERETGKSKDEAESIAWATANKRGYLDNKNKKKGK